MKDRVRNKKGFTLAELLIVVAIIAVLVAISIPIFTYQLRKARLATNQANARAAYASAVAAELDDDSESDCTYTYVVDTAQIAKDTTAKSGGGKDLDISSWNVDTEFSSILLGDDVAEAWVVVVDHGNIESVYPEWTI